jgi:hypothetical protein
LSEKKRIKKKENKKYQKQLMNLDQIVLPINSNLIGQIDWQSKIKAKIRKKSVE